VSTKSEAEMNSVVRIFLVSAYLSSSKKNQVKRGAGKTCLSSSVLPHLYTCAAAYVLSSICLLLLFLE
jgi:hypothetical protein